MKYNPGIHNRRSIRLQGCDYSQAGTCFVTLCTHARACVFGQIAHGRMVLNDAGRMVASVWGRLPIRFDHMELDEFVVMPNSVGRVIQAFKSITAHQYTMGVKQPG